MDFQLIALILIMVATVFLGFTQRVWWELGIGVGLLTLAVFWAKRVPARAASR
jgi:hypothetical protein